MSIKGKILTELEKRPRRVKELKSKIGNDKKLVRALDELLENKTLTINDGVYSIARKNAPKNLDGAVKCILVKLGKGFGFAKQIDGSGDVFVPGRFMLGAMPGDEILVKISATPRVEGTLEGEVVSITKEKNNFVGTVDERDGRLVLIPDAAPSTPIAIKKSADGGVCKGEKAAIVIMERAENHDGHRAGVAMRFGAATFAKQCAKAILYGAGIEKQFPAAVKAEAKRFEAAKVQPSDVLGRKDYRGKPIFTIDSSSTKDIDDAISIERVGDGYKLGVHIADVSYYVKPNTALGNEAMRRGTSVYYADSVVPMLPRQLSNGICSLNEGEDRLAFTCMMQLDASGKVKDYSFVKSVINSRVKGVYTEVNEIIADSASTEILAKYGAVSAEISIMDELYQKLAVLRAARGSMDIESGEAGLIIDENGVCVDVVKRERGVAECMIEEFMLLANTCAASLARRLKAPFVYRIHEQPEAIRIERLEKLLSASGVEYRFEGEAPTVLELSKLLDKTRGTGLERAVHTGILRSMAKARYDVEPKGHFGLALEDYAHFTSPIRRFPDLAIHRILTDIVEGVNEGELQRRYGAFASEAATISSEREVLSMQVERDTEDCYKAEYMQKFIGEEFDGIISSVTPHGIYVELNNTIEGLIRIQSLGKGEPVLVDGVSLSDPLTGEIWRLGASMRVQLASVDVPHGNIDFVPAKHDDK
ncbi:MAG: VacB/RNase II family 3'-5' exoribonuclease [Oscillospiraceae bacterium]